MGAAPAGPVHGAHRPPRTHSGGACAWGHGVMPQELCFVHFKILRPRHHKTGGKLGGGELVASATTTLE